MVVGCGLGAEAEHVASLGYLTTGFDLSATAIRTTQKRYPGSPVAYAQADLFDLPSRWRQAFDLVVEIYTVQALPRDLRPQTVAAISDLIAPGGRLLVVQNVLPPDDDGSGPPWPLTREDVGSFTEHGLTEVDVAVHEDEEGMARWRAELVRPVG